MLLTFGHASAEDVPRGPLPSDVTPTKYGLELAIDPGQDRFTGTAVIDATANTALDHIWIHGEDLAIDKATLTTATGETLAATWTPMTDSGGVVRLGLPKRIAAGAIKIAIRYSAPFNKQLEGFYRADEGGERYIFSQMEPIAARRAFPSFDEPRFKTPFDIAVTVPAKDTAVSNTPVLSEEKVDGGRKRVHFATTKPLPTYLIALAVGPFDVVEWPPIRSSAVRDYTVPLRGIAAKGKGGQLKYAIANTGELLVKLEEYFGIPYPYEKLDIIAAIDFSAGAMENAGAIVYREQILLFDENASIAQKRRYATVHAHEMAHQWFGDLVTPSWWTDIWLNESFATWMEVRTTAAWDPKGEYGRMAVADALNAMGLDSWRSARRIAEPVKSNDDIANAFDSITYDKGGGVLAMFEHYYGADTFRQGVQLYLKRHAWGTASAADFIQALADASGDTKGVEAFQSFLNQPGVPVVRANLECSKNGSELQVSQSRYLQARTISTVADLDARMGLTKTDTTSDQRWKIPLCIASGTGNVRTETCAIMTDRRMTFEYGGTCPAWILPNSGGVAYVRVALDRDAWQAVVDARNSLRDTEVLAVIDSLDSGLAAGGVSLDDYLVWLRALLDRDRGPGELRATWDIANLAMPRLIWMKDVLATPEQQPRVAALIRSLFAPFAAQLGLNADTDFDTRRPAAASLMRPIAITAVAGHGHDPAFRAQLRESASAILAAPTVPTIDPMLLETTLVVAVQEDGAPTVAKILARLKIERDGTFRQRMLSALTRSHDAGVLAQVRALTFDPALRVNEVPTLLYGMMRERMTLDSTWIWFKQNFDAIAARTPPGGRGELAGMGAEFCSVKQRDDYTRFFRGRIKDLTGARRVYASTLEKIDACIAIADAQRPKLEKALAVAEDAH